jgi:hypothetical protein
MRWEMALRSVIPFCAIGLVIAAGLVLLFGILTSSTRGGLNVEIGLLLILFAIWLVRMMMLYLREPLWRMRMLVALGIAVADNIKEMNMAILVGSAVGLGLKVLQIGVVTGSVILSIYTLRPQTNPIIAAFWLVIGGVFVTRLVRAGYTKLHAWFTRVTLRSLQGEPDPFLDTVRSITARLHRDTPLPTTDNV